MAEIVAILVGPVLELGKCIVVPIKRQFAYLCCFSGHIKSLTHEAEKLEEETDELQNRVNMAERKGEGIVLRVKTWLTSAKNEIQVYKSEIAIEIPKVQSGCSTIISRYSLCKKAEKRIDAMKELRDRYSKFNDIALPAPPAAEVPIRLGEICPLVSRKKIEEDIVKALEREEVNIIGICGMGGVGKTSMAKTIMKRVIEDRIFDEAAIAVASQQEGGDQQEVLMLKIQGEISESLGLKLEEKALGPRAHKLLGRLKREKRSLIVVDDIWQTLELEDIGIPCESGAESHCIVLLTSRDRKVLTEMKAKVYAIETLSETEALSLFTMKSGISSNDSNLLPLAKDIAKECGGLPLALVTVGSALKDEKHKKPIWEDTLRQLKDANPADMSPVLEEVYKPLRRSYDLLDSNAQSLFLLCCLFPEDSNISLNDLTLFCIGLRIFEGLNLEQVRNRVVTVVEKLKSRCLLLDGSYGDTVRMHDVVRDVAIFIASKAGRAIYIASTTGLVDGNLGHSKCEWISFSLQRENELPKTWLLNFPSLHLLMMHFQSFEGLEIKDFSFLQGQNELSVLSFEHVAFKSMLITMPLLENIRALHLVACTLEDISVVGNLLTLEILSCCQCSGIKELPTEIGRLNRLKLLEFRECYDLIKVPPGVLSNLIELEELTMIKSFDRWEPAKAKEKGSENANVSLHELQSLHKLMRLNIEIADYTLAAEDIQLPSKIVKYDITLGRWVYSTFKLVCSSDEECFEKKMYVNLPSPITAGNWIRILAGRSDKLQLAGYGWDILQAPNVKLLDFQNFSTVKDSFQIFHDVKHLVLFNPPKFEEMCNAQIPRGFNFFENLQRIEIWSLPFLKHVWSNSNQDVSLSNLRTVKIADCRKLRNLFPLEMAMVQDGFLRLEELTIQYCGMMDEVFSIKETEKHEEITSHLTFPQLKKLRLQNLDNLTIFSRGIESIEFPTLTDIEIVDCPKLISLVSSSMGSHENSASGQDDDSIHLFCKVKFGSLKTLQIRGYNNFSNIWCHQIPNSFFIGLCQLEIVECDSLKSLFSYSIARNLVSLEDLKIRDCKEMVKAIEDEDEITRDSNCPLPLFPSLQYLGLNSLPKLGSFCQCRGDIELPMLSSLSISGCPIMKIFTMGSSISAPKLEAINCSELTSTISPIRSCGHDDDTFHLFFNSKDSFHMFRELKHLLLNDLPNFEEICNGPIPRGSNSFKNLEQIRIRSLPVLQHLWKNLNQDVSLRNLRNIDIADCRKLRNLFPLEMAMVQDGFLRLEELTIQYCGMMDEVFSIKETEKHEEITSHLTFPQLKKLRLQNLDNLTIFSRGIESIEFPTLTDIEIVDCPKLISLVSSSMGSHENSASGQDDDSIHLFCKVKFGSLKTLQIRGYNNFSNIWCHQIPNSFFIGLCQLEIVECDSLKSLFSYSIARNLVSLEDLKIRDCKEMVKAIEDEDEITRDSNCPLPLFPSLQYLGLNSLPKLGSFCQCRGDIELPMLSSLSISGCPIMKIFTMGSSISAPKLEAINCSELTSTISPIRSCGHDDDTFHLFFNSKDSFHIFHELKHLFLNDLPNFEEICNGPIPRGSNSFKNLEQIRIRSLPVLKHLWKNPNQDVSLSNLRNIDIADCRKLRNLFPLEMAMVQDGFLQLEVLKITNCGIMDEVFLIKETEKHEEITSHLTFPQLKILILRNLENLIVFSKGFESIEFPAISHMEIVDCPKLISLVSSSMGSHENSASGQDDDSIHLFCKVKFGSLKTLQIGGYNNFSNIWCHQIPNSFFTGLCQLEIVECDSLKSLFSYSIARNLVSLEDLKIRDCKEMVKVIEDEDEITRDSNCPLPLFASLQYLSLNSLPKLGSFCQCRGDIELPMLSSLSINGCPIMKIFTMGSLISAPKLEAINCSELTGTISPIRAGGHDDDTFHLFCNPKVTFGMLKSLTISSDVCSIWCHQISDSFFTGLNQISLFGCHSIGSLFSYAIVRNLVNLGVLEIAHCEEMVKVIEDDEEITGHTNCPLLLFPSLEYLKLDRLPKLGSFCEWGCDIELPMLNDLSIDKCPMMKVFTMRSSIRTPKLDSIVMDDQMINVGDLNEVMKLHNHIEGGEIVEMETV